MGKNSLKHAHAAIGHKLDTHPPKSQFNAQQRSEK